MSTAARAPRWRIYLLLGRISNLPTVWTDTLAGMFLAGAALRGGAAWEVAAWTALALSLFYTGGMFLNDAFDRAYDRVHRPARPLPQGQIGAAEVWALGFGQLALGEALLAVPAARLVLCSGAATAAPAGFPRALLPLAGGAVLAALIVYYNYSHKRSAFSPLTMALCRAMVYLTAAAAAALPVGALATAGAGSPAILEYGCGAGAVIDASVPDAFEPLAPLASGSAGWRPLAWGTLALVCYLIGLTYVAKQENLREVRNLWPLGFLAVPFVVGAALLGASPRASAWGWALAAAFLAWMLYAIGWLVRREGRDIPRAVVSLLAGICLLDGMLMSAAGAGPGWALLAAAAFALTLLLQRYVPGT